MFNILHRRGMLVATTLIILDLISRGNITPWCYTNQGTIFIIYSQSNYVNLDLEIYYTTDLPPLLITSKWVRFVRVCGNSQKLCRASCKVGVIKSVLCKRLTDESHSADYGIFHLGNPLRHHFNEIILEHSPYLKCIVKTITCTNTLWDSTSYSY